MSDVANTFGNIKPEMKDTYSDGKKTFKKIKSAVKNKKCKCSDKCGCKK